jgi:flagellar biosynthesis protein FlhB
MADELDKSEKATPKRRGEARNRGQVARSQEIASEAVIVGGLIALGWVGPLLGHQFVNYTHQILSSIHLAAGAVPNPGTYFMGAAPIFGYTFLWLGVIMAAALIAGFGQVGFEFADGTLKAKWENLNPVNGVKRLFSWSSIVRSLVSILKLLVIFFVCKKCVENMMEASTLNRASSPTELVAFLMDAIFTLGWRVAFILGFIAAGDYAYQRWHFEKTMKMSKTEVKDETKQSEGNPEMRGKIRSMMRQRHRQSMMKAIPQATVIITNPTHVAIAVRYDRLNMKAPKVTAKGLRLVAERIKEIARDHNIPIIENKPLARSLYRQCQVGSEIPAAFFQAVAIVLAQVYRLANRRGQL